MNAINTLKTGQLYLKIFPYDKALAFTFPEMKIIAYMKRGNTYLPIIIIGLFLWYYFMDSSLALTIFTALFAISLPVQGLFFLGKRALSPLPLNLLSLYNHLTYQLTAKNVIPKAEIKAGMINFLEFIKLLRLAKLHLGSYFGDNQHDDNSFMPY